MAVKDSLEVFMPFNFQLEILKAGIVMQRHDFETNYSRFFDWREILEGLSGFVQRVGTST